jgi:pSer/pThr/pTyr-binding forkhead associated (FHA) protein
VNRKEALEFLELPENATDEHIFTRISDKQTYFKQLTENAPNEFLKKLHLKNLEKIESIKSSLNLQGVSSPTPYSPVPGVELGAGTSPSFSASNASSSATITLNNNALALLVRHTEDKPTKTYYLYQGENVIGRSPESRGNTITIDDDQYVSRVHAVVKVINGSPLQIEISDDAESNGGKASKNGTYINSNNDRIKSKVRLREEDTIQIGMTKFILRLNNANIKKIVNQVEESSYMKTVIIDLF